MPWVNASLRPWIHFLFNHELLRPGPLRCGFEKEYSKQCDREMLQVYNISKTKMDLSMIINPSIVLTGFIDIKSTLPNDFFAKSLNIYNIYCLPKLCTSRHQKPFDNKKPKVLSFKTTMIPYNSLWQVCAMGQEANFNNYIANLE